MKKLFFLTVIFFVHLKLNAVECIAHRGNSSKFLENSLASIKSAIEIGSHGIEFDVRHTKDKKAILLHDKDLKRVSKGDAGCPRKSSLKNLFLSSLKKCRLKNNEKIPLLEDALALLGNHPVKIFMEFKDQPVLDDIKLINRHLKDQSHRLYFISFNASYLVWLFLELKDRRLLPNSTFLHLQKNPTSNTSFHGVNLKYQNTSRSDIGRFHKLNKIVGVWTVNSSSTIKKFINQNVDFVTTNYPETCLKLSHGNRATSL